MATRYTELAVLLLVVQLSLVTSVTVNINKGSLKGVYKDSISHFFGVPYAAAPVGDLRFAPPQEVPSWQGEYDSTALKPICLQDVNLLRGIDEYVERFWNVSLNTPTQMNEDCLYLNIFVPGQVNASQSLAVMVLFHDDALQFGSSYFADGAGLAKEGNVILVTLNYRLGALGFFGRGNFGLLDQHAALTWIQHNIKNFGGDPDRVTLLGSLSGSFSIALHVVSPSSRGLFKRAISPGMSALNSFLVNDEPEMLSSTLSQAVNCSHDDMACMRSVPVDALLGIQIKYYLRFLPTVDGNFLPAAPKDMLMSGNFNTAVDCMFGLTSDFGTTYEPPAFYTNGADEAYFKAGVGYFAESEEFEANAEAVSQMLHYEYKPTHSNDKSGWARALLDMIRDAVLAQINGAQMLHSGYGGTVYSYYFDQPAPPALVSALAVDIHAPGASENLYLFGYMRNALSSRLIKAWSSFARTGSPKVEVTGGTIDWPKYNASSRHFVTFMDSMTTNSTVSDSYPGIIDRRLTFWSDVLSKVGSADQTCTTEKPPKKDGPPTVTLAQGVLEGIYRTTLDHSFMYEEYVEIPYAEPPLGDLRWRAPMSHRGWTGVRKPSSTRAVCPQFNEILPNEVQKEDCLYLDVYVPYGVKHVRYRKLPVMVFIHGGAYTTGSKNYYLGAGLIQRDVILVSINYRLGALGFLSTGDEAARGNFGLLDQQLALQWVKTNIEHFGGNPEEVTIFGESAGAGSVSCQMVSPDSKGLFKRAIAESGSIFAPWALIPTDVAANTANNLAAYPNCSSENSYMMINCLRKVEPETLVWLTASVTFAPVVDGHFIPDWPDALYANNATNGIVLMTGSNQAEGYTFLGDFGPALSTLRSTPSVATVFNYYYEDLVSQYGREPTSEKTMMMAERMLTDYFFAAPVAKGADLHSRNGQKTYRYYFHHRPAFSLIENDAPEWVQGLHGDELSFVFGTPTVKIPENIAYNVMWPREDVDLSNLMMDMWTNFAQTGDPNRGRSSLATKWPMYSKESPSIFKFSGNTTMMSNHEAIVTPKGSPDQFRPDKVTFWNDLVQRLSVINAMPKPCPTSTTTRPAP